MNHKQATILGTVLGLALSVLALFTFGVQHLALIRDRQCASNGDFMPIIYQRLSAFPALALIVAITILLTCGAFHLAKWIKSAKELKAKTPTSEPDPFTLLSNAPRLDGFWYLPLIDDLKIMVFSLVGSTFTAFSSAVTMQVIQVSYITKLPCVNQGNSSFYYGSAMLLSLAIGTAAFYAHRALVWLFKPEARINVFIDSQVSDAIASSRVTMHQRWSDHVMLWNRSLPKLEGSADHVKSRIQDLVVSMLQHKNIRLRHDTDGKLLWYPAAIPWNVKRETINTSSLNVEVSASTAFPDHNSISFSIDLVHAEGVVMSVTVHLHSHTNTMEFCLYPSHSVGGGTALPWKYRKFNSDASATAIICAVAHVASDEINRYVAERAVN